jgi:hypothetical protein
MEGGGCAERHPQSRMSCPALCPCHVRYVCVSVCQTRHSSRGSVRPVGPVTENKAGGVDEEARQWFGKSSTASLLGGRSLGEEGKATM